MANLERARNSVVLLAILVEGGLAVLALALGWLAGLHPALTIRWDWLDALKGIGLTMPLLLVGLVLLRWPFGPFIRIKHFTYEVLCPLLAPCTRTDLFGIAVLAGLGEELLFRAVFQTLLTGWLGLIWGLVLASLLFGILHAVTLTYAIVAGCMGIYLGVIWLLSDGNLLVPIVAHALYDFILLWYLLYGPGVPPQLRQAQEPEDAEELEDKDETVDSRTPFEDS